MSIKLTEKQVIFEGRKVRLEVHHFREERTGKRSSREVIAHPGAVVILPFIGDDRILLIKNTRHAVNATLIELPAGTLEHNENPMNAAGRELLEETGFLAGRLQFVGSFFSSPGIMSEKMFAYAAYDLQEKQQALEEGEEIEVMSATLPAALEMIRAGQIMDGKTIATILLYDRFHQPAR